VLSKYSGSDSGHTFRLALACYPRETP
jgi:hypothetical protein